MGSARHPRRHACRIRRGALDRGRHHRYGHDAAHRLAAERGGSRRGDRAMTFDLGMPLVPEISLFVLAVLLLFLGFLRSPAAVPHRDIDPDLQVGHATVVGWVTFVGLLAIFGLTFLIREGG